MLKWGLSRVWFLMEYWDGEGFAGRCGWQCAAFISRYQANMADSWGDGKNRVFIYVPGPGELP